MAVILRDLPLVVERKSDRVPAESHQPHIAAASVWPAQDGTLVVSLELVRTALLAKKNL
jgi:hypothetical protein